MWVKKKSSILLSNIVTPSLKPSDQEAWHFTQRLSYVEEKYETIFRDSSPKMLKYGLKHGMQCLTLTQQNTIVMLFSKMFILKFRKNLANILNQVSPRRGGASKAVEFVWPSFNKYFIGQILSYQRKYLKIFKLSYFNREHLYLNIYKI